MKILNFGSCNIDYVYSTMHIVKVGETISSDQLKIFPGGKGLNQAIATARAGSDIYFAGALGTDGQMLKEILSESGVDTSLMTSVAEKNGHAIIQVTDSAENSIIIYPGSNGMISCEYVDSVLENFDSGDFIVLQNEINNINYIIRSAYKKGLRIVLNPSPFNDKMNDVDFSMISYLMVNEVEAAQITGVNKPEECLNYFKAKYPELRVVMTLGAEGCVYVDKNEEVWQSAFLVEAVDTTAAGDTFTGYFVAKLADGASVAEALKLSSLASAISVSRKGAAPSIPVMDEVLAALKELKPRKGDNKTDRLKAKIESYIDENISVATLSSLAKELGYSSTYTGSLVKKVFADSFCTLLQKRRCEVAHDMLLNTNASVSEIIEKVGYNNESFFRKKFKERYGKTPLHFRNRDVK